MGVVNRDGALYMATGIDNSGLNRGLNEAEGMIGKFEQFAKRSGMAIGSYLGIQGMRSFANEIINVRGELQMLESSFDVLLGGKGVSGFMAELKKFAVDSPLSLTGVSNAAQTLLGFNIEAERVIPTIKQIGDISMGNEQKFQSLILAFAQMSSTGKLMGQDLLQMINAGFNPLSVISEKTGKSIGELKKEMESGAISSQMVTDAFASATAEGGKFYGMTQKQAEGIKGLQAQLEGGLQDAFNKIGQSQEGLISGGYNLAISIVENYEEVGKAVMGLITTYGVYKAAVIFVTQAEAGWNVVQLITYKRLLLVEKAQKLLNATMLANPYVLVATIAMGVVSAMWALGNSSTAAEEAIKKANEALTNGEAAALAEQKELVRLRVELERTTKGTDAYKKVKQEIIDKFGKYHTGLNEEITKVGLLTSTYDKLTAAIKKSSLARAKDDALKNISEEYKNNVHESLKEIREVVDELNGSDENKERLYRDLYDAILNGNENIIDTNTINRLNSLKEKRGKINKEEYDKEVNSLNFVNRALYKNEELYKAVVKAKKDNQKLTDEQAAINKLFPDDLEEVSTEAELAGDKFKSAADKYNEAAKKYNSAKKYFEYIDANKSMYSSEAWKAAKDEFEAAQKAYEEVSRTSIKQGETAAEKALKQQQKTADVELKLRNDTIKAELDATNAKLENRQKEIDLLDEGFAKEQAQLELNHNKELLAIDKRTQELIEREQERRRKIWDIANPNGSKTPYKTDVNSIYDIEANDREQIGISRGTSNQNYLKGTDDLLKTLLGKYQDYNAQRIELNKKYESDLAALEAQAQQNPSDTIDQAIAQLKKDWSEALSSINLDEFQESIDWSTLFSNLDKVSTEELVKLRDKLKTYLSSVGNSLSPQDLKTVTDAFENLNEKIADKKPISELKDGYLEYKSAINEVIEAKKEQAKYEENTPGYIKATKDLTAAETKRREGLVKMSQSINKIGSVGSQMVNSGRELTEMLTNLGVDVPEQVSKALDGIGQIMGGLEKIDLTNPASIISGAVSVISGLGNTIAGLFTGTHKTQKDTERLQEVTSKIEQSNEAINKLIEKRISLIKESTAAEAQYLNTLTQEDIDQQQRFIEDQFNNLQGNWLFAKKGKNNNLTLGDIMRRYGLSDLAEFTEWWESGGYNELLSQGFGIRDKEMWDSIINGWTELGEAAIEAEKAMKEAFTGTTFDALKDSLDDIVAQADLSFSDISSSFQDHMKKAILNMVKSKYLTEELEKWYNQFAEAFSDGDLSSNEADALQKYYEEIAKRANEMYNQALNLAGIESTDTRQASEKGFASASQDSIDYLTGLWTLSVEHTRNIKDNVKEVSSSINKLKENSDYILNHVQNIDENTENIRQDISGMREDISSIITHGITLVK